MMHFFALLGTSDIRRIRVTDSLQTDLAALFEEQAAQFLDSELQRVAFHGRYSVDEDELFEIDNFDPPAELMSAARDPGQVLDLVFDTSAPSVIKAIIAAEQKARSHQVALYFQSFDKSQLLVPIRFALVVQQGTFHRITEPGLTLGSKLVAAYTSGRLYFRSFVVANRFLDLSPYFTEATNSEITDILSHEKIYVQNQEDLLEQCDAWMRKRFGMLKQSDLLHKVSAKKIQSKAGRFGLEVHMKGGRIIFPQEKKEAKNFLRFLLEGFFEGELTGTLYQSNSHRPLDRSTSS